MGKGNRTDVVYSIQDFHSVWQNSFFFDLGVFTFMERQETMKKSNKKENRKDESLDSHWSIWRSEGGAKDSGMLHSD